jgi:transposase-like protein
MFHIVYMRRGIFMHDVELRRRFVLLRGRGVSYVKISEELGVNRNTLARWGKEYACEVGNAAAMELEGVREEYLLGREHRVRVNGTQLSLVTEELLGRDLGEVPTWRLFNMQRRLVAEIERDAEEIEFSEEVRVDSVEAVRGAFVTVEKWTG